MKSDTASYVSNFHVAEPNDIHERLLKMYWDKKNLEEFLPQIANYSSPQEMLAITLSQLSMIENELIWLMRELSTGKNKT